jgi:hypothetical protein
MPVYDLQRAANAASAELGISWAPVVDGVYLPASLAREEIHYNQSRDIPLIVGSVFAEMSSNAFRGAAGYKNTWDEDEVTRRLVERFGNNVEAVTEAFIEAYPDYPLVNLLFIDTRFRQTTVDVSMRKASQDGADIFTFMFTYELPVLGGLVPWHNVEIPFVFGNVEFFEPAGGTLESFQLQDEMIEAWIAFAYTGNPNHDGLIEWPVFTNEVGETMIFDVVSTVYNHHDRELLALLTTPSAPAAPVVTQTGGVDDHAFDFIGTFTTAIGEANTVISLYQDNTFEGVVTLPGRRLDFTSGTWVYEDGIFVFTDDEGNVFTSELNDDEQQVITGAWDVGSMTNTSMVLIAEKNDYVPFTGSPGIYITFAGTIITAIGEATATLTLSQNQMYIGEVTLPGRRFEFSSGTWVYENGVFVLTDNAGNTVSSAINDDGQLEIRGTWDVGSMTNTNMILVAEDTD